MLIGPVLLSYMEHAVVVAHYYTDKDIQWLAEETGGHVSDSLDMARFGNQHSASTLVVAGVRFMGETAKILNPEKTILMPTLQAECSLDISCQPDEFSKFCDQHPARTVVVYARRATWRAMRIASDVAQALGRGWATCSIFRSEAEKVQQLHTRPVSHLRADALAR